MGIYIYRGDIYIPRGYNYIYRGDIYTVGIYIYRGDILYTAGIYIYRGDIIYTLGIYIYTAGIYISPLLTNFNTNGAPYFDPRSGGPRLIIVVRSLVYALRVHVRKDPGALRFTQCVDFVLAIVHAHGYGVRIL